jgi:tRNA threonylcarbamoyl adenosine modification protein YeaZ
MTALILDTSSETGYIAVSLAGRLTHTQTLAEPRHLSKILLPSIQTLWQERKFDYILLGIGPGSFTGTRVGAVTAKTLSFALEIPLISFSSTLLPDLEAIAQLGFQKYASKQFDSQIELVYFPLTP